MADRPRVWAPTPERVALRGENGDHELRREPDGWWTADVELTHGDMYGFVLDDDIALPDPRSIWQPDGVHAPSRHYEHDRFRWTDERWHGRALPGSVIYELHIGTFTPEGTFEGAIKRLDHLGDLGVGLVEVMPVNAFDGDRGWGYDGVLWYAVHESYGGPDAFKRFVDACHGHGLGVVLDVVYNHLGPSGAYLDRFGPYFGADTAWGRGLNLDGTGSDEVRRYVIDNAVSWFRDFHIDGLRLDAVHALRDIRAVHILEELSSVTDRLATQLDRPLTLIAESDLNDPRTVTTREAGGLGTHAQWTDDIHHALHAVLTGESRGYYADFASAGLDGLAKVLRGAYFHDGTWSSFRGRAHGRPIDPARLPGHRFVAYLQTHDQVGNRATGDRLSARVSPGLLGCGAALVLCSPFTPMIFMGEEWGAATPWQFFAAFPDPTLAEAVRQGRCAEFAAHGWDTSKVPDPIDRATFDRSVLDWSEPERSPHRELLELYRRLLVLRCEHPELVDPGLDRTGVEVDHQRRWLVSYRGELAVVCNFGAEPVEVPVAGAWTVLLSNAPATIGADVVGLAGESFAVVAGQPRSSASRPST